MRKLTERQAKNCEEAREPACHCRCGGQAHGGKRGGGDAPMSFYYSLPEDDPHYTPSPEKRKQIQQEKQEAKHKERQDRIDAAEKVKQDALSAYYKAYREEQYDLAKELHVKFMEAYNHVEAVRKSKDGIVSLV
jgi:flagellar biosynthesis/type III secretory pathway protein FliH